MLISASHQRTLADKFSKPNVSASDQATKKRWFVHRLFTELAPRYDAFNRLVSCGMDAGWRDRAVMESGLSRGMRVLDVCTGTGDLALVCADRTQGESLVVGLDFTETMLRGAQQKQRRTAQAVSWLQGDAQTLPFAAGSFDRVFIGFSTRNLSDLKTGVSDMARVLKPGGQLVILETGRPNNWLMRLGYFCFLFTVAPLIGWMLTGKLWPFTYLARSVKRFLTPTAFVGLIDACDLSARYVPLSFGLASLYLAQKPVHA